MRDDRPPLDDARARASATATPTMTQGEDVTRPRSWSAGWASSMMRADQQRRHEAEHGGDDDREQEPHQQAPVGAGERPHAAHLAAAQTSVGDDGLVPRHQVVGSHPHQRERLRPGLREPAGLR